MSADRMFDLTIDGEEISARSDKRFLTRRASTTLGFRALHWKGCRKWRMPAVPGGGEGARRLLRRV